MRSSPSLPTGGSFRWPRAFGARGSLRRSARCAIANLFNAYLRHLPEEYHDRVKSSVAGVWFPIDVAMAHYEACDLLGLSTAEQLEIGRTVTQFAHRTSYSLALRLATEVGVTPWACFAMQHRLWQQVWVGGAVATFKLGPKEARVEIVGWPCSRITYCRTAGARSARGPNGALLLEGLRARD